MRTASPTHEGLVPLRSQAKPRLRKCQARATASNCTTAIQRTGGNECLSTMIARYLSPFWGLRAYKPNVYIYIYIFFYIYIYIFIFIDFLFIYIYIFKKFLNPKALKRLNPTHRVSASRVLRTDIAQDADRMAWAPWLMFLSFSKVTWVERCWRLI